MKQTYVTVQDHFPSLHFEAIDPPVLSALWLKSIGSSWRRSALKDKNLLQRLGCNSSHLEKAPFQKGGKIDFESSLAWKCMFPYCDHINRGSTQENALMPYLGKSPRSACAFVVAVRINGFCRIIISVNNEDLDQTVWIRRLIITFTVHIW